MIKIKVFTFSPIQENTYVLSNESNEAIIIDPGCYFSHERETLQAYLAEAGLTPVRLLNTHCHLDHVFGEKWVAETYGLTPYIHPNEKPVLEYAPISGKQFGLEFDNYDGPLNFLQQEDEIVFGENKLVVKEAPGHSPGSICFYCAAQNFIIGGDVIFRESVGRTDLPGGNHEQLMTSIREQIFTLPDETIIYPGHGRDTLVAYEKKHNPYV